MTRRQQVKLLIIIACGIALLVALYLLGSVLERMTCPPILVPVSELVEI